MEAEPLPGASSNSGFSPRRRVSSLTARALPSAAGPVRFDTGQVPAPTALTMTSGAGIAAARSRASSRSVSARGSDAARVTTAKRVREASQQGSQPSKSLGESEQYRAQAAKADGRLILSRIAMIAFTQSCTSAGISSSRNACPVGAVSTTTVALRSGSLAERFGTSMMAASSSMPGGASSGDPHGLLIDPRLPGSDDEFVDTLREAITKSRKRPPRVELANQQVGGPPACGEDRRIRVPRASRPSGPDQPTAEHRRSGEEIATPIAAAAAQVVLPTPPLPPKSRSSVPDGTTAAASTVRAPAVSAAVKRRARVDGRAGCGLVKWPPVARSAAIPRGSFPTAGTVARARPAPTSPLEPEERLAFEAPPSVAPPARRSRRRCHPVDDDPVDRDVLFVQRAKAVARLLDGHSLGQRDPADHTAQGREAMSSRRACPSIS